MEAGTVDAQVGTGSKTIADLLPLATEKYADEPAQKWKAGEEWSELTYRELGEIVREVALGLIDIGIQPGDKVAILSHTRPEWTQACHGILCAGATVVTVYQTNSAEECQYVLEHSEARAVVVEDAEQLEKIGQIRDKLPKLEHVIVLEGEGGGGASS